MLHSLGRLIKGFDIVGDVEVSNVLRLTEPSTPTETLDDLLRSSLASSMLIRCVGCCAPMSPPNIMPNCCACRRKMWIGVQAKGFTLAWQ